MKRRWDESLEQRELREKLIGLGEQSMRKSYYPELQQRLGELETYRALLDESNDAIFLLELPRGQLIDYNKAACAWLGYEREELMEARVDQLADFDLSRLIKLEFSQPALAIPGEAEVLESLLKCKDGHSLPVEMTISLAEQNGNAYAVIVARDISERRRAEEELRSLNARLEERVRERTQQLEELNASLLEEIEERNRVEEELKSSNQALEELNLRLKIANEELERMASTDRLTGAWNRRYFEKQAEKEMERARRYESACSMIILDIDHFKGLNDRFGHLVGDLVLFELAHLLQDNLRGVDSLTRWGGEEFVILAPHTEMRDAYYMAEKLRRQVEQHCFPEAGRVTVSMGVAQLAVGMTLDKWIKAADDALFEAKALGRNRVVKSSRVLPAS